MKGRFISQFALVVAVALAGSTVYYFLLCKGLRQVKRDSVGKLNYMMHDTTHHSVLFIGGSTMHVDVNAALFDSLTGSNSFNAGMDGLAITEVNTLLRKFIASHGAPGKLFMTIDETSLGKDTGIWYFAQYYPFVGEDGMERITEMEPKLLLGKYFPPGAVTFFDDPLKNLALIGLVKDRNEKKYSIPLKGFEAKPARIKEELPVAGSYFTATARGWKLLKETVDFCRANHTEVTFLLLPMYKYEHKDASLAVVNELKKFATAEQIPLFDFSNDARFAAKEMFYDRIHLSGEGAEKFTRVMAGTFGH